MSVVARTTLSSSRLWRRGGNIVRRFFFRVRDSFLTSFGGHATNQPLFRLIPSGIQFSRTDADAGAVDLFLEHRFDLLGSGWVNVFRGMECLGFEGHRFDPATFAATRQGPVSELPKQAWPAARRLRALISPGYVPIDWQIDFKSGFRWSERTWYRDIAFGHVAGADIKVPWELSRLQHLPELAIAYLVEGDRRYRDEFRNQVLDWIASNPPRFGANWASTMDVGIRIANVLIAYDLCRSAGDEFDDEFNDAVQASTHDHARHIVQNLEWSEAHRSNHYLGDVCGLLTAAAFLPPDTETDSWFAFAVQELVVETERQFLGDGGHFEASTSYHRLCAEMVTVCAALCSSVPASRIETLSINAKSARYGPTLRLSTPETLQRRYRQSGTLFPGGFYASIGAAARFTAEMTKPDGRVVQIGDNDSGRFLRIGGWTTRGSVGMARATYQNLEGFHDLPDNAPYVAQESLNHQQWLAWADAVVGPPPPNQSPAHGAQPSGALARGLVRDGKRLAPLARTPSTDRVDSPRPPDRRGVTHRVASTHRVDTGKLLDGVSIAAFADFGVYVIRSNRLHLVIRCGNAMQDAAGTHAHDDQLSVEVAIDGTTIVADPGTYIYTASPTLRNRYRSALAHAAPAVVGPTSAPDHPPFSPPVIRESRCEAFGIDRFRGAMMTEGGRVTRSVLVTDGAIEILDEYELDGGWVPASTNPWIPASPVAFSPGYGVRAR
jgi:hypothetical protein